MSERVIRHMPAQDNRTYNDDVVEEPVAADRPINVASRVIWFVAGIVLILLAFRFVLALLGANPQNGFADFIYTVTQPMVSPFFNLFNYNVIQNGVSRFEIYTLIAMAVYAAIAWGLSALVNIPRRR
jgi:ABC-type uncharacterized transport system permease subunit